MTTQFEPIGENVQARIDENGNLLLRINPAVQGTVSASGKSIVLASTRGNTRYEGISIGLNVYRKRSGGTFNV